MAHSDILYMQSTILHPGWFENRSAISPFPEDPEIFIIQENLSGFWPLCELVTFALNYFSGGDIWIFRLIAFYDVVDGNLQLSFIFQHIFFYTMWWTKMKYMAGELKYNNNICFFYVLIIHQQWFTIFHKIISHFSFNNFSLYVNFSNGCNLEH